MKVDVKFEYTTDKIKLKDAKVLEQTEESASLILKHKEGNMADILDELTKQVKVTDLSIEEMSTDDVIAKLYKELKI